METELMVANPPRDLLILNQGRRLIAEAKTIDEVRLIRDQAEAIRVYMRKRDASIAVINDAAEIKIVAEARMGELLAVRPPAPRGQKSKNELTDRVSVNSPSLMDLGIHPKLSERCQSIAAIPKEELERHIRETKDAGEELTTAGVLRLAKSLSRDQEPPPEPEPWIVIDGLDRLRAMVLRILERWPADKLPVLGGRLISMGEEILERGEIH